MMISIGAIRYRLKRIQEISGIDLTRAKDFFSIRIWRCKSLCFTEYLNCSE